MTAPSDVVQAVIALLDRLGIPYHLGGSLASSFYGVSRMTADADVVIEASREQLDALAAGLADRFYVSREAMAEAYAERRSFNAILLDGPFKVDFFLLGSRPFDREEFQRADFRDIGLAAGVRVRIKTAEDLVLRKLEWFRLGGEVSERQWSDVVGILRVMHGQLDEDYMDHWAADIGVFDLLTRVRTESMGD